MRLNKQWRTGIPACCLLKGVDTLLHMYSDLTSDLLREHFSKSFSIDVMRLGKVITALKNNLVVCGGFEQLIVHAPVNFVESTKRLGTN